MQVNVFFLIMAFVFWGLFHYENRQALGPYLAISFRSELGLFFKREIRNKFCEEQNFDLSIFEM